MKFSITGFSVTPYWALPIVCIRLYMGTIYERFYYHHNLSGSVMPLARTVLFTTSSWTHNIQHRATTQEMCVTHSSSVFIRLWLLPSHFYTIYCEQDERHLYIKKGELICWYQLECNRNTSFFSLHTRLISKYFEFYYTSTSTST